MSDFDFYKSFIKNCDNETITIIYENTKSPKHIVFFELDEIEIIEQEMMDRGML